MNKEDLFEETIKLIEESNLSERKIRSIIYDSNRTAKRAYFRQYDKWQKIIKERKLDKILTDEEVVRLFFNKTVCINIERYNKANEENSGNEDIER